MSIEVHKKNEAFLQVRSDDSGILMELSEHYTFYVPGYKFMPAYKNKFWDGKIRLFNTRNQLLPYGLLNNLQEFAKARGYEIVTQNDVTQNSVTVEELVSFLEENKLPFLPEIISYRHGIMQ